MTSSSLSTTCRANSICCGKIAIGPRPYKPFCRSHSALSLRQEIRIVAHSAQTRFCQSDLRFQLLELCLVMGGLRATTGTVRMCGCSEINCRADGTKSSESPGASHAARKPASPEITLFCW